MQKQVEKTDKLNSPTRRQKVFAFFKDRKEWVKLNASYVIASTANFSTAIATAHIAQKAGVSKENAGSWISFTLGFTAGFITLISSWYFMHTDKYQKDIKKIAKDAWTLFKNIWKAQAISFGIVIPTAWLLSKEGLATSAIVVAQQILDRIIYIPAFNFFSRHQIKEMEKDK